MRKIEMESHYCDLTYAGCYEGRPAQLDPIVLMSFANLIDKMWGERPTFCLNNPTDGRWKHAAWLDSSPLVDGDGSHLVLVWFSDDPPWSAVDLETLLARFEWERHAKDYEI
jgi:hypothetical protein